MSANTNKLRCQSEQIAAYLDGDLDDNSSFELEQHIKQCSSCGAELTGQRRLLCAFDSALAQSGDLLLPTDFARIVAAHAESDMRGVRARAEHKRALRYCILLTLAAFALLGAAASKVVFGAGRAIVHRASGVFDLAWTTAYDALSGVTVISRVVGKGFIPGSYFARFAAIIFLALVVVLLSRLIASYHRMRLIE